MAAEAIARALNGRKAGSAWSAQCPAHDDHTPSLSLTDADDGKVLVFCHAGCSQESVIAALRARRLWVDGRSRTVACIQRGKPIAREQADDEAARTDNALALWQSSGPAEQTLVENYLESRCLRLQQSRALRFNPALKHPCGTVWPAMVALVSNGVSGAPVAVHRTFLAQDGNGKAAVDQQKMMLGPCRGGAVRLADPGEVLMVGEGIETCLAVMQVTGHPAWAAMSTSGLRSLALPEHVRDVIVLADGDDAGEAAARDCASRWKREGRRVRIARPPRGMDFNDMLMGRGSTVVEEARHER